MKILHILDHSVPLHSGYTFRTLSILKEQRALGWDTLQLTSSKQGETAADEEECEGFTFYRTRVPNSGMRALPVIGQAAVIRDTERRLDQVLDRVRPDVLHAHSPCLNGIAALRAARRRGLPVVYEVRAFWEDAAVDHGTTTEDSLRYRLTRGMESWLLKRVDAVTTICEGLRADIVQRGVPASRITVIPNAVNTEQFPVIGKADAALKDQLGLRDCFVLGFIGSFYGYEGLDLIVDALPALVKLYPEIRLLLVGGGFEDEALRRQAAALGVADKVIFTGRVPHKEVMRYYSVVDLLLYPRKSMRLTETVTPLKPLEAMAQGSLFAASSVGGHRELVADGQTGFLFEPGRPQAIVEAVQRVRSTQSQWDVIRANGRRFVEGERNWRVSVARYKNVYEPLVRGRTHG